MFFYLLILFDGRKPNNSFWHVEKPHDVLRLIIVFYVCTIWHHYYSIDEIVKLGISMDTDLLFTIFSNGMFLELDNVYFRIALIKTYCPIPYPLDSVLIAQLGKWWNIVLIQGYLLGTPARLSCLPALFNKLAERALSSFINDLLSPDYSSTKIVV